MGDSVLMKTLKELSTIRSELQKTKTHLDHVFRCQKYHQDGMDARKKGIDKSQAPFNRPNRTEAQSAYKDSWLIGWEEQDQEMWLRQSVNKLQSALSDLLETRRSETAKTKRKIDPEELERMKERAWKKALATMREVNQ